MPRNVTVTFEDGSTHTYQGAPDDATPQQVAERAQSEFGKRVSGLDGGRSATAPSPRPQSSSPRQQSPATPAPSPQMEEPEAIVDTSQAALDAAALPTSYGDAQFSDEWLAAEEAKYQASLGPEGAPPPLPYSEAGVPPAAERGFFDTPTWEEAKTDLAIGAGGITEAAGDIVGLIGNPLNQTINSAFGTELSTDLGGTLRNSIFGEQRGNRYVEAINQGMAGGLMTAGAANLAGNAAGNVAQRGLYELGNMPIRDTVAGATGAISSTLAADAGAGPLGQIAAGVVGGMGGFGAAGLPQRATAAARAERFATREAARNPYAAFDAEIAADVAGLTRNRAVSPTDPKGRAAVTATQINSLERSYTTRFSDMITDADITPERRLELRTALDRTQSMPMEDINALRGDPLGDAVADGLTKRQRLRQLTPELKAKSGFLSHAATVTDLLPIPGMVGRGLRVAARASGDGEAARVNAAQKLIARERGYARLGEMVGPSGAKESEAALRAAYGQGASPSDIERALKTIAASEGRIAALDQPPAQAEVNRHRRAIEQGSEPEVFPRGEADTGPGSAAYSQNVASLGRGIDQMNPDKAMATFDEMLATPLGTRPQRTPAAREMAAFRRNITDPAPDPMDDALALLPGLATKRTRARALAQMEGNAASWDERLADPSTAPKPKATRTAAVDPIDRMVEQGIPGEFGAMRSFETSLGISREDATRVLRQIADENPDLAREVNRVVAGHNTSVRTMGPTLRPLMRAQMERMGITPNSAPPSAPAPRPVPIDEAAQSRLASATDESVPVAPPSQREIELQTEDAQIDAQRTSLYDTDPTYAAVAGQGIDPLVQRQVAIREELTQIRAANEGPYSGISRPQQWEQGRNRNQTRANASIDRMMLDANVTQASMDAIGNAPVQIRDGFKNVADAEAYIIERVIPTLEADGIPAAEIRRVREYLFEIAQSKTHANQAAYDLEMARRPVGRPPSAE